MTTTASTIVEKPSKKMPDGKEDPNSKERSYLLIYRYTNRVGQAKGDPIEKAFHFKGDLENARIRARRHCELMEYRYINCRPFIVDLDAQEKLRDANSSYDEDKDGV